MLEESEKTAPADEAEPDSVRDEDGALRADLVERIAAAIEAGDAATVGALAGDWHESDVGALIDALDAPLRPKLVELLGEHFHFKALTEVDRGVRLEII